jgi:hypothetical protein
VGAAVARPLNLALAGSGNTSAIAAPALRAGDRVVTARDPRRNGAIGSGAVRREINCDLPVQQASDRPHKTGSGRGGADPGLAADMVPSVNSNSCQPYGGLSPRRNARDHDHDRFGAEPCPRNGHASGSRASGRRISPVPGRPQWPWDTAQARLPHRPAPAPDTPAPATRSPRWLPLRHRTRPRALPEPLPSKIIRRHAGQADGSQEGRPGASGQAG